MAPTRSARPVRNGIERVREELLTALHFGRLAPGDRAPSVRRLASKTGMNCKTVHRAYTQLAREGLLDTRPGSGTFISETATEGIGQPSVAELLAAARRCRASARALGLSPREFSTFLEVFEGNGLQDLPLAVVECNHEQLGIIARELRARLGIDPHPVLLSELSSNPAAATRGLWGVVTTDCHRMEVAGTLAPLGVAVYRLALDPVFPQLLAERARWGPVIMVVSDRVFGPVFRRLLHGMSLAPGLIERFHILEPRQAKAMLRGCDARVSLYVSPLVDSDALEPFSPLVRRLEARWHVESGSLARLRARLALDLSKGRRQPVPDASLGEAQGMR